jgi:hypothetical protein
MYGLTTLLVQAIAIFAQPVSTCSCSPLVLGDITTRRTGIIVVVPAVRSRFTGLVYGIEIGNFCHFDPLSEA